MKLRNILLALCATGMVASCGGGSSSSQDSPTSTLANTQQTSTTANSNTQTDSANNSQTGNIDDSGSISEDATLVAPKEVVSEHLKYCIERTAKESGWKTLEDIEVLNCDFDNKSTIVNNISGLDKLPNLKELQITGGYWDYDTEQLTDLSPLSNLKNLEVLHIDFGNDIQSIEPLRGMESLKSLHIWPMLFEDLDPISTLTNLETLSIQGAPSSGAEGGKIYQRKVTDFSALESLHKLQHLNLSRLDFAFVDYIGKLSFLENMPSLKSLYLTGTPISDFNGIQHLTELEKLSLTSRFINDDPLIKAELEASYQHLYSLSKLKSFRWDRVQESPLDVLKTFKQLEYLNLQILTISENDNRAETIGSLSTLKELRLVLVNNFPLSKLQQLENLERLNFSSGSFDPTHFNFPVALSNLNHIVLQRVSSSTDTPLTYGAFAPLPNLQLISIENSDLENIALINQAANLNWVSLSINDSEDLSFFSTMDKVEKLALTSNGALNIDPLLQMKSLTNLFLYQHDMSDLSQCDSIAKFKELRPNVQLSINYLCSS
ncbi:hypothetical protein [Pseudoalteromonas luteoviolacea]|uniref:Internalin n=1 Tax=Pseudoalteromonas luteoviolacea H33 TaxID=1365251 RepID=A0A161Y1V3_9GAMM|nr:hypothetical protein [Pseudoalteromonas luteoviolacea]KZN50035.1 hypothetical protein N476_16950 [Pseudoalteromonas luteoviolacea H33]KZN76391.1 hypothetical protein N477_16935 [Pseudoalteromonas luteoviolacea H33-S]